MNSPVVASRALGFRPVEVTLGVGLSTGVTLVSAVCGSPPIAVVVVTGDGRVLGVQVAPIASGLSTVRCSSIDVRSDPSAATSLAVGRTEAAHKLAVEVGGGRAGVDYGPDNSCFRRLDRRLRCGIWSFS
jgi:hypothetical protein